MQEKYDSTKDTLLHISHVQDNIQDIIDNLKSRGIEHDKSKLSGIEKYCFDTYTPKLKECEYNSPEYKQNLISMSDALEHHYANNSHHPEYYSNGIFDMNLLDLLEMLADWKAAVKRNPNGDLLNSLYINKEKYKMDSTLFNILRNTLSELNWIESKQ